MGLLLASISRHWRWNLRSGTKVLGSSVGMCQRPPFKADFFDVIFAADVLCHRDVRPVRMLEAIFAVLKPGGIVILNNPAYEWLRSYHDTFVHTARRYTTGGSCRRSCPGRLYGCALHVLEHNSLSAHGAQAQITDRVSRHAAMSDDVPPWLIGCFRWLHCRKLRSCDMVSVFHSAVRTCNRAQTGHDGKAPQHCRPSLQWG